MGFLDKVKEQATAATAVAKDAAAKTQSKLDDIQAKKAADAMLRDLGALSYGSVSGRDTVTSESDASRIVDALRAHEAEHGQLSLTLDSPAGRQGA